MPISEKIAPLVQRQDEEENEGETFQTSLISSVNKMVQKQDGLEEEEETVQPKQISAVQPSLQRQEELAEEQDESLQTKPFTGEVSPLLNRQTEAVEEKTESYLQAKELSGKRPTATRDLESRIQARKGSGEALSESTRAFFEPRFGADFSHVRVHTGSGGADTAKSINAKAFTVGENISFGKGQYAPESQTGRRLLAHELTHVVQQQSGKILIQRKTDRYTLEPVRPDAEACLVHIHGNEKTALSVVKKLYKKFCVNLIHTGSGRRLVRVDVPGKGFTCRADPNRIFDDSAITSTANWNKWNWIKKYKDKEKNKEWNRKHNKCLNSKMIGEAQKAIRDYRKVELVPKIRQCGGMGKSAGKVTGMGVNVKIPVIVFHNNTDFDTKKTKRQQKGDLNIKSYLPGGIYKDATESDESKNPLKSAIDKLKKDPGKSNPRAPQTPPNPHIQDGKDEDNFILVTKEDDFVALVRKGHNVVLQKQNIAGTAVDDGSLSVALSREIYLNIEAQHGSTEQLGMGEEVVEKVFGINPLPCPKVPPSSSPSSKSKTSAPKSIQPKVNNPQGKIVNTITSTANSLRNVRPPISKKINQEPDIQRKTFPKSVRTKKEKIRFLLGQLDPKKLGFKKVKLKSGKFSYLRPEVAVAFKKMRKAAQKDGITLELVSATRTFEGQKKIWNLKMQFDKSRGKFGRFEPLKPPVSTKCGSVLTDKERKEKEWDTSNTNHKKCWNKLDDMEKSLEILKTSSAPGTSRHHWGTDIDLNSVNPEDWNKSKSRLKNVYAWLTKHASKYGFYQSYTPRQARGGKGYYEEKWHWSYRPFAQPLLKEYIKLLFDAKVLEQELKGKNVKAQSFIVSHYQEYVGSVDTPLLFSDTELTFYKDVLRAIKSDLRKLRSLLP